MKKIKLLLIGLLAFQVLFSQSYNDEKTSLTVLNIDAQGISLTSEQLGNLVRLEVAKLELFEVMDKYDVAYLIDKNNLNIANCYGKICLVETGKIIGADKMLSGSIEQYADIIIITLRLVDVNKGKTEKTKVIEFLNLPDQLQTMIHMTLSKMFDKEINQEAFSSLTNKYDFENALNNPENPVLNLSGPRMGFTCYTGESATILSNKESVGGYDAFPMMFQFGYQFEQKYLNEGNFQALFEFVPMITGLDQGMFLPSFTVMNGLRINSNGLEFGFGPTFYFFKEARGYYDEENVWYLESEFTGQENPYNMEERLDSRGDLALGSGFVFAFGKSFKSGNLNIPVNVYIIPNKDGMRFGASFGFNAKR